jgi:FkbM family methyltransferase
MRWLGKYIYYLLSVIKLLVGIKNPLLIIKIFIGKAGSDIKTIQLRRSGLKFKVRGAMDVWSIKETFLDRFYERYGFVIQPGWNVLDIGAALGEFTLFAAHAATDMRVFAFEPFPQSVVLLNDNIRLNNTPSVQVFPEAVAAKNGTLTLDLTSGEPLQFQSHADLPTASSQITVNAAALSDLFARLDVQSFDLVKMDCEGAEYDIFFNTAPDALKHIRRIVMEYHDNATSYTHLDLVRFLSEQGFVVETFTNPVHGYLGYLRASRP